MIDFKMELSHKEKDSSKDGKYTESNFVRDYVQPVDFFFLFSRFLYYLEIRDPEEAVESFGYNLNNY